MSEAHQERAQGNWWLMVRQILSQRKGPMNQPVPAEAQWQLSPHVMSKSGEPLPSPPADQCPHPLQFVARGANQHGTWKKCNLCLKQLKYQKYSLSNPPPAKRNQTKKNVTKETYVSTGPPVAMTPMAAPGTPGACPTSMVEIQTVLAEQTQHMANTAASSMSQAVGPVMEAIHQLSMNQQVLQQMVMNQQEFLDRVARGQSVSTMPVPVPIHGGMISDEEEMGEASDGWVHPRPTQ